MKKYFYLVVTVMSLMGTLLAMQEDAHIDLRRAGVWPMRPMQDEQEDVNNRLPARVRVRNKIQDKKYFNMPPRQNRN